MNQQCKVCGEPAAGFHFGAFTCEGCKVSEEKIICNFLNTWDDEGDGGTLLQVFSYTAAFSPAVLYGRIYDAYTDN